ncbi:L-rhamnose mutarotase [Pedobacter sp. KBS0701]|uniref:L-rhamnose mutarotase n=1 Tax=unclassified Pedobacter TaxID=2628915 RepID=UPI00110D6E52|nr:L-rhamnose mutarotase [Pedobacter sp. KBS0701]QDW23934.1 L-rhamnose mutarotase [Pedobacter sp. KBS0701]
MKKYALALDLIDDAKLIAEYEAYHKQSWPEITDSIIDAGILKMEIFRISNRLFMLMETTDDFTFSRKQQMDQNNEKVQLWEELMWKFQQPLPFAGEGEKWVLMEKIFELDSAENSTI